MIRCDMFVCNLWSSISFLTLLCLWDVRPQIYHSRYEPDPKVEAYAVNSQGLPLGYLKVLLFQLIAYDSSYNTADPRLHGLFLLLHRITGKSLSFRFPSASHSASIPTSQQIREAYLLRVTSHILCTACFLRSRSTDLDTFQSNFVYLNSFSILRVKKLRSPQLYCSRSS